MLLSIPLGARACSDSHSFRRPDISRGRLLSHWPSWQWCRRAFWNRAGLRPVAQAAGCGASSHNRPAVAFGNPSRPRRNEFDWVLPTLERHCLRRPPHSLVSATDPKQLVGLRSYLPPIEYGKSVLAQVSQSVALTIEFDFRRAFTGPPATPSTEQVRLCRSTRETH